MKFIRFVRNLVSAKAVVKVSRNHLFSCYEITLWMNLSTVNRGTFRTQVTSNKVELDFNVSRNICISSKFQSL